MGWGARGGGIQIVSGGKQVKIREQRPHAIQTGAVAFSAREWGDGSGSGSKMELPRAPAFAVAERAIRDMAAVGGGIQRGKENIPGGRSRTTARGGGGVGGKKDPKRAVSKTGKALQAREHGHLRQPQHTRRRGRPATAKQGGKRVVRVVRASLRRASFVDVVDARRQFPSRFCCCLMLFFVRHSLMITSSVPCVFSS